MRGGSWRSIRWCPRHTAQLARAAEHLGERDDALTAYRAVALARRHRPGRSALPPGQAAARCGQAARSPPRGSPFAGRSASVPRGASALARAGRTGPASRRPNSPPATTPSRRQEPDDPTTRRLSLLCSVCRQSPPACRSPSRFSRWRRGGRGTPPGMIPEDRAGVPNWNVDEHFKNDVFTFVRIEYDSFGRGGYGGGGGGGGRRGEDSADSAAAMAGAGPPTFPTAT